MNCSFCDQKEIEDIQERIIREDARDKKWSAFVPPDPEIFGHIIVTYLNCDRHKKCIRDISSVEEENQYILDSIITGVRIISNKRKNHIDNVDRVYVVMAGEDSSAHLHFHLFPKYGFLNDNDLNNKIAKWVEKYGLSKGEIDWRRFYANPTKNFKFRHDFSYLGEIHQKYDDWKRNKMNDKPPSKDLLIEMKDKLEEIVKL